MATKSEGNVNNVSQGAADDQRLLNSPTPSSPSSFQGSTTSPTQSSGLASSHLRRLNDETPQPEHQDPKSGTTHAERPPQDDRYSGDRFLYFSSDKRRIEYLLGRELPHMPTEQEPVKRKKRLSFEVDPLYALSASFPELFDDDDLDDVSLSEFLNDA